MGDLHNGFRQEPAWKALGCPARIVYIELKGQHNGFNNGRIEASTRFLAEFTGLDKKTVTRALEQLTAAGFIVRIDHGSLGVEGKGTGSCWRLTELGVLGGRPSKDYRATAAENKSPSPKRGQDVPREGTGNRRLSRQPVPSEGTM